MRRSSAAYAITLGLVCSFPAAGAAQRWQVDLGGSRVGYDTTPSMASAMVAPSIEWTHPTLYALLSGGLAAFDNAQFTAQARSDASLLLKPRGAGNPLRAELAGTAGGSVHSSGYRTASTRGEVRLHASGRSLGVWLGGHAATGWTSDTSPIATAMGPTASAWAQVKGWNTLVTWSQTRFNGSWFPEITGRLLATGSVADVMVHAGWRGAAAASGVESAVWGGGTLAVWLTPRVAVTAAMGTYPLDLLQALPRGRYLSASIRLASRRPTVWTTSATGRAIYAAERGGSELRFNVPGASRVAVVGDWTAWQPLPLQRAADGRWVMRITLGPGVYRFNLVVDGTRWIVPQGVAAVDDGFGGKTALLVVP